MSKPGARDLDALERILGHRFSNRKLLDAALRHSSMPAHAKRAHGDTDFERLEFLGDRVVGLVVAEVLEARFPSETEGDLARRHAALVSRRALADLAASIDLGTYLHLTRGEDESGGRRKPSVLADAFEALVGAMYRDGGFAAPQSFLTALIEPIVAMPSRPPRDPKTALQEWAQGRGLSLPTYRTVKTEGPAHAPKFEIEVRVDGHDPARAAGTSKRNAERAAAAVLLEQLTVKE